VIPPTLHFVYGFRDASFRFFELVNLMLAVRVLRPRQAILHTAQPLSGRWFDRLMRSDAAIEVREIAAEAIPHPALKHYAHRADYYRLAVLRESGGIYLDTDVFVYRQMEDLLAAKTAVLGKQQGRGLCNAVILAPPRDPFVARWLEAYEAFDGTRWDHHSVILPAALAADAPQSVRVLADDAFFTPLWHRRLAEILEERDSFAARGYACHLWNTICRDVLTAITPRFVLHSTSFYAKTVRRWFTAEEIEAWIADD
jgi:hypothetical protein